jgi:hypothetical protein
MVSQLGESPTADPQLAIRKRERMTLSPRLAVIPFTGRAWNVFGLITEISCPLEVPEFVTSIWDATIETPAAHDPPVPSLTAFQSAPVGSGYVSGNPPALGAVAGHLWRVV